MDAIAFLLVAFNLVVLLPLDVYALIRGINVQRYNLGIARGRRYATGFWWRQATALARSRACTGANFILTCVLSALGVVMSLVNGSWIDGAICSYVLVNALIASSFSATQLPVIGAKQAQSDA